MRTLSKIGKSQTLAYAVLEVDSAENGKHVLIALPYYSDWNNRTHYAVKNLVKSVKSKTDLPVIISRISKDGTASNKLGRLAWLK